MTSRFKGLALARLLGVGCAVVLAAAVLIELAQAQQQFAPPAPPPPPPVFNPPSPNRTVPQPSYTPVTPSTPSAVPGNEITSPVSEPAKETPRRKAARESEQTPAAETPSVHHRHRGPPAPVAYRCGYYDWGFYGCVRTYTWAFPCQYYSAYCYPYYGLYGRYRY
jgi:hypothetical protein